MTRRRKRGLGSLGFPAGAHEALYRDSIDLARARFDYGGSCGNVLSGMRSLGRAHAHAKSAGEGFYQGRKGELEQLSTKGENAASVLCGCKARR